MVSSLMLESAILLPGSVRTPNLLRGRVTAIGLWCTPVFFSVEFLVADSFDIAFATI